jgi:polyribonucleotide nucleotidyltransferase
MNNKKIVKKETTFAGKKLTLETGELAFSANMAVKVTYGETVLLVTAVSGDAKDDIDFFPLTVNYEERMYASGMIKSSRFVKRDGKANDDAVISKRLIDHAIRPLFPRDYMDEVQVVATVLSLDETADPEFAAMVGVSAALTASDIPWSGPMLTARVGLIDGQYTLGATHHELHEKSDLAMTVSFAGTDRKFLAVETIANNLPEEKIIGAMNFAREGLVVVSDLIMDFAKEVNPENKKYEYISRALPKELTDEVNAIAKDRTYEIMKSNLDKIEMKKRQAEISDEVMAKVGDRFRKVDIYAAIEEVEKHAMQHLILDEGLRPDGRGVNDVRQISSSIGVLPRAHGSAVFTRGITQALTIATLGSPSDQLVVQDMYGESKKRYVHYYNMPPYASGETGSIGNPKSREIGHGKLAEKAIIPVLPDEKDFPYTMVVVTEILSSSGSTSMASTCASCLSLMDAGVPLKAMVAGVGVGLITNDDFSKYKIMTDLAYMEDAFGFLDFKMTGTRTGVTAIQSDMKAFGIPMDLVPQIFEQSRAGRMHVLDQMEKTITTPKPEVSKHAPKMLSLKIDPEKIGQVIGAGGKVIREIQDRTNSVIFIDEDGSVVITGMVMEDVKKASDIVTGMTREIKVGETFEGTVVDLLDFGALVEVLPGKVGLMHVSEISSEYITNLADKVKVGDKYTVKVISASDDGKFGLSHRALEPGYVERPRPERRDDRGPRGGGNFRGGNDRFNNRR